MDHAAGQRQADAGADACREVGEPVGDRVDVQVDTAEQQHQGQHQPGQPIQSAAVRAAAGSAKERAAAAGRNDGDAVRLDATVRLSSSRHGDGVVFLEV